MSNLSTVKDIEVLLRKFSEKEISIQTFCQTFENMWNFQIDRNSVPDELSTVLDHLFDEVVLFSPFPREQWEYPKYRDEIEIRAAASVALCAFA